MGLDPLSAIAPARVRVLVLPVGRIVSGRFLAFLDRLQLESIVRLGDVTPDGRPHRTMFSPLAFQAGLVIYDLSTAVQPSNHSSLSPFELYREQLAVIGIADSCNGFMSRNDLSKAPHGEADHPDLQTSLEERLHEECREALGKIISQYPRALVHQILLFDHPRPSTTFPEGLVAVPSPQKSTTTTIKTIMCDLTSQLLANMTTYAKSIQSLSSIETPRAQQISTAPNMGVGATGMNNNTSRPSSANNKSRSRSPAKRSVNPQDRMSMPVHISSSSGSRAATPDGRPLSPPSRSQTPPTTFDEISAARAIGSPPLPGVNDSRRQSRDRSSVQGYGAGGSGEKERIKGKGRIGTVIGALYLLAGRWPDALRELVDSATVARANSDYVWLARALDYILVTLLMYAWAGMDFKVPQILYPGADRTSKSSSHKASDSVPDSSANGSVTPSRLVSLQNLIGILPDLVNYILNLYVRAWTFTEDKVPLLAFSESVIRLSKLLAIIRTSHGNLDDPGLQKIVLNTAAIGAPKPPERLTPFPTKAEITTTLFRAFPSPMSEAALPVADRTMILAGIASVLSELGCHRKKALVLKELVSTLLPALVQARKDGAAEMGIHPAASLVTLGAAVGNAGSHVSDGRLGDSEYGMRSFLSLLCTEYGILLADSPPKVPKRSDGAGKTSQSPENIPTTIDDRDSDEATIARALRQTSTRLLGAQALKLDVIRACINICEALPDLEGVLCFSADTLRTAGSGIAPGPDSSDGSPSLPIEDQVRLVTNISRTLSASQQLGIEKLEAEYWDEFLVRGIELADTRSSRIPTSHSKAELDIVGASETTATKNPFIYNPFGRPVAAKASDSMLVAQEESIFRVTLQNLYDFDLEIERIALESSGAPLKSLPQSILVGPYRTQTMSLTAIPTASGSLTLTGCIAKIKGCRERRFPLFSAPWSLKLDVKTDPRTLAPPSQKAIGVELTAERPSPRIERPQVSNLQLNVIDVQPNIVLKSISLPQSAMMLLEGETKTFSVTLQNVSSTVPADFLTVTFKDSTATQLQSALGNKDLTSTELYELELSATKSQSFKWLRTASDQEPKIDPGGSITIEIEVFGKPGLSHGSIVVDFGYLGVPKSEVKDRFYTRQLAIPLAVTVNASVELVRNDFIPFTTDFAWQNQKRRHERSASSSTASTPESQNRHHTRHRTSRDENTFHSLLSRLGLSSADDDEHCLLLLDVRNSWPSLLTTSIQVRQNPPKDHPPTDLWKRAYTVHETQQPGHTSRLVLILPRLYLSNPHAPIPSLNPATKRQYVVNTSKDMSPAAELAAREAFWYREEILQHIRATWKEDSTGRTGIINLRSLRLSARMIPALKLQDLAISLSVAPCLTPTTPPHDPGPDPTTTTALTQLTRSKYSLPTSTFFTLTTTLRNRTPYPIHPLLRLQPTLRHQAPSAGVDLSKRFLWNGVLQRALPVLRGGERRDVELGFCVLCGGEYEVGACVEDVRMVRGGGGGGRGNNGGGEGGEGEGRTGGDGGNEGDWALRGGVGDGGERRRWVAEEPCVVVAVDGG